MRSKPWLPDAIGACAALTGLALLVVVAGSGNAIGLSVGALVGGGFAFGVLGCIGKEGAARLGYKSGAGLRSPSALAPAAIDAMPPLTDATASEFDEGKQGAFAAVVSLTEAQVERQRERQRREHRANRNRA